MKILGIDPSTYVGMCLLVDAPQTNSQVKSVLINYPKLRGYERLQSIATGFSMIVDEWQPDIVFIEGYAMNAKFNIVQMVEIGTVIRRCLYAKGIDWYDVPPTTLKKWTTGKGNAKKPDMAAAVAQRWGFLHKSDDVIDAYAVARLGQVFLTTDPTLKGVTKWNLVNIGATSSKPCRSSPQKKVCAN